MNGFVLRRISDGKYVTPPGSLVDYVKSLENAHVYPTREDAERDRWGVTEQIVPINADTACNTRREHA